VFLALRFSPLPTPRIDNNTLELYAVRIVLAKLHRDYMCGDLGSGRYRSFWTVDDPTIIGASFLYGSRIMSKGNRVLERPAHCIVQLRAYEMWDARGRCLGDHQKDWSDAELEFESKRTSSGNMRELFVKWRATELWLLHGRPFGRDWDFWLRAQREVDNPEAYIDRVRRRAYEIWEEEDHPDGESSKHWAKAEGDIAASDS
jgi:hypothetical protein